MKGKILKSLFVSLICLSFICTVLLSPSSGQSTNLKGFQIATIDGAKMLDTRTVVNNVIEIANMGGTIIRFPLYFKQEPDINKWLKLIDAVLKESEPRNLIVVVDMHNPNGPKFDENLKIQNVNNFVNKWTLIAQHLKDRKRIWYDLLNEPKEDEKEWRRIASYVAKVIRQIDSQHKIVYAPPGDRSSSASNFTPLEGINRQVLGFHFYDWTLIQKEYKPYRDNRARSDLQQALQKVSDAGKRYGLPVYISEVAIKDDHLEAPLFLWDFTSICDQLGIDLTVHAFRESEDWNYERNPAAWDVLKKWIAKV